MNSELEEYQGKWFDVNSETVIELDGDRLTFTTPYYSEEYTVVLKTEGDTRCLANTDGDGFGDVSNLYVGSNGVLVADEMILDADGHRYMFVREEQLEAEREIVDASKDMPKVIESTDISEFFLNFSTKHGRSYGLDDKWSDASYSWSIEKQEDGTYQMDFTQGYDSYMGIMFHDEVSAEYVKGLADLINELNIPSLNGYIVFNNVSLPGYGLSVEYESGEEIYIHASGNGADSCVLDLKALMDYALTVIDTEE